ncbi:hypothetical protein VNO80_02599 [Phaseolus coccineus]|uniref:Uncharacterized protein n=1 Tax=Phaseolus coccineus TaxID=3886 RepID=A0AAN9RMI4_PHACN
MGGFYGHRVYNDGSALEPSLIATVWENNDGSTRTVVNLVSELGNNDNSTRTVVNLVSEGETTTVLPEPSLMSCSGIKFRARSFLPSLIFALHSYFLLKFHIQHHTASCAATFTTSRATTPPVAPPQSRPSLQSCRPSRALLSSCATPVVPPHRQSRPSLQSRAPPQSRPLLQWCRPSRAASRSLCSRVAASVEVVPTVPPRAPTAPPCLAAVATRSVPSRSFPSSVSILCRTKQYQIRVPLLPPPPATSSAAPTNFLRRIRHRLSLAGASAPFLHRRTSLCFWKA